MNIISGFRVALASECEFFVGAGCDAAFRSPTWDRGDGMPFAEQLGHYRPHVASPGEENRVAAEHAERILPIQVDTRYEKVSSRADAIRVSARRRHAVPSAILYAVGSSYREVGR